MVREDRLENLPDQRTGKREVEVGGDAVGVSQPQGQPAGHAVAWDGNRAWTERGMVPLLKPIPKDLGKGI